MGAGAGAPVAVGGREIAAAGPLPAVGGRGGAGTELGAGVGELPGGSGADGDPGAAGPGPEGREGSLIVAVAEGLGGREIRTVSFLGWTLAASPGLGGRPPPMGAFGLLSDIAVFVALKLGLAPVSVKLQFPLP